MELPALVDRILPGPYPFPKTSLRPFFPAGGMTTERTWHLKNCELFERLSAEEISRLESCSRFRKFPRKSPIYLPADEARSVLLLVSGRAKISTFTPDGKQGIIAFIEPGELFGELAVFDSSERGECAEAVENSTVVMIPGDEIMQLMEKHAEFCLGVTKLIGLRRRRIERRLKYLLFRSSRDRLVHLLLELVEDYGSPSPAGVTINLKLSHQDLANVIGSTRETVTIVLGELQAEGVVKVGRRKLLVTNVERLAKGVQVKAPQIGAGLPAASHPSARPR